jgi:hypothetical protein
MRNQAIGLALLAALVFAPAGWWPAEASEPCCGIVAIDTRTATVTAKDTKTGRTFQFKVSDAALLRGLKVGQAVWADFTTMKVSLQPERSEPCCNIVGGVRTPAAVPGR